jgi:hypothetical protein
MEQWTRVTRGIESVLLFVQPQGGQRVARRNAWASLVEDGQRRAQRLEAERSVQSVLAAREEQHQAAAV